MKKNDLIRDLINSLAHYEPMDKVMLDGTSSFF